MNNCNGLRLVMKRSHVAMKTIGKCAAFVGAKPMDARRVTTLFAVALSMPASISRPLTIDSNKWTQT
jgi:hypothetical protein